MWEEDLETRAQRKFIVLIGVVAAAAIASALWYWYDAHHRPAPPPPAMQAAPPPPASTEPQIAHPMPAESGAGAAALPALNDSDQLVRDSLAGVLGHATVERFLVPQNIVRHIVATVDNLPRKKVAIDLRPVKPTPLLSRRRVRSRRSATPISSATRRWHRQYGPRT
jgi:hypothetical protein